MAVPPVVSSQQFVANYLRRPGSRGPPQPRGDDGLEVRVRAANAKHTGFPGPTEARWDGGSVSEV